MPAIHRYGRGRGTSRVLFAEFVLILLCASLFSQSSDRFMRPPAARDDKIEPELTLRTEIHRPDAAELIPVIVQFRGDPALLPDSRDSQAALQQTNERSRLV